MWITKAKYEKLVEEAKQAKANLVKVQNSESAEISELKRELSDERKAKEEALKYKDLVRDQTEADILWQAKKIEEGKLWVNRENPLPIQDYRPPGMLYNIPSPVQELKGPLG